MILLPFYFEKVDLRNDPNHECAIEYNSDTGQEDYVCGCSADKRAILVSVKVLDNQVDLFDIEFRDHESKLYIFKVYSPNLFSKISHKFFLYIDHDISNSVLHVMDNASRLQNIELNEELIDADMENI